MWKFLVDIATNYIKKNLLPRLDIHPAAQAIITKSVNLGEEIKDIYTDGDKNNKAQLERLWDQNCEEVLVLGIRGVTPLAVKNPHVRKRVLAVLSQAVDDIKKDDEVMVLDLVEALQEKSKNTLAGMTPISKAKKVTSK